MIRIIPTPYMAVEGDGSFSLKGVSVYLKAKDQRLSRAVQILCSEIGGKTGEFVPFRVGAEKGHCELNQIMGVRHVTLAVRENTRSSGKNFAVGDQVRHGKFGPGLVLEVDDKTVTVMFDSVGRKKLAKDVAPIEKI